jgi:hypothetical protein
MTKYKSTITAAISRTTEMNLKSPIDLSIIFNELVSVFHIFVGKRLQEVHKTIPASLRDEFNSFLGKISKAKNLEEVDTALFQTEEFIDNLFNLKIGELEFEIIGRLQSNLKELRIFEGDTFPGEGKLKDEVDEKKGKILPFKPEGGKH